MDAISYSYADKAQKRIKRIIENPDSTSGIVTVPKVIGAGENVTIPAGRVAVLPNVQVDGTLNIEGEVFIPSGATFSKVVETEGNQTISGIKTFSTSPIVPTPTNATDAANKAYVDTKANLASPAFTGTVTLPSTTSIGTISSAELGYLDGVTSAIQAQINDKAATNQTMYVGTTAMAINRATAAQTLTGVSIDGNAATASSTPTLSALQDYVWSASTTPTGYPLGVQTSFVNPEGGFPNYGSLVNVRTYSGGGGSLQLYVPYSAVNGGNTLKVRFGNYEINNGNSWTNWKTLITDENIKTALNATGNAPVYACRAWVNFNGMGTVAIRASGNVSSITDNGTGDYTINFTTAMIDSNYAPAYGCGAFNAGNSWDYPAGTFIALTTSLRIKTYNTDNTTQADPDMVTATIFR